jgi:hypothetical protein
MGAAFVVGACAGIWAACGGTTGGGGGGGGSGSCANYEFTPQCFCSNISGGGGTATAGICFEYTGSQYCFADGGTAASPGLCVSQGTPACPTGNQVGTCWKVVTNSRYYSPNWTAQTAQTDCTNSGGCFVAN